MTFDEAFAKVVGTEGGYVNDPNDPGGETKYGISKRSHPDIDIKSLTLPTARLIYSEEYWKPLPEELPDVLRFHVFDFAVNSSVETAIRYLQLALEVADDGHFGPVSKEALKNSHELAIIVRLNCLRLEFMTRLKNWPSASKGWSRRIASNLLYEFN